MGQHCLLLVGGGEACSTYHSIRERWTLISEPELEFPIWMFSLHLGVWFILLISTALMFLLAVWVLFLIHSQPGLSLEEFLLLLTIADTCLGVALMGNGSALGQVSMAF